MPRQHVKPVPLVAYSISQASAATGIRPERLSAAARSGELHAVRIGVKTKISFRSLQDWINSHDPASRQRASA